jgi:hypothetical protein
MFKFQVQTPPHIMQHNTENIMLLLPIQFGCSDKSNAIYIYMHGLPKAKIIAQRSYCALPGSVENLNLSAWYDANYSYFWSDIPASASFSPNGSNAASFTTATITLPGTLPYQHEFIVEVTDLTTGCRNTTLFA